MTCDLVFIFMEKLALDSQSAALHLPTAAAAQRPVSTEGPSRTRAQVHTAPQPADLPQARRGRGLASHRTPREQPACFPVPTILITV